VYAPVHELHATGEDASLEAERPMAKNGKRQDATLETFSKVVEAIYDCALDHTRWQDTLVLIAELCRSQTCILTIHDLANERYEMAYKVGHGYTDEFLRLHEEKYKVMNPLWPLVPMLPIGEVRTQFMLIDDHEFWETRFYREWVKPQCFCDNIFFKVLQTDQRIGAWAAHRIEGQPRYGDADVRLVTLLSPHVCRAITISDALNLKTIASEALEATLDGLTAGVYLTDSVGRVTYMNRVAEQQTQNGNVLRIESSRLAPLDRLARTALTKAIDDAISEEAANPDTGFSLALPSRDGAGLVATILPLNRGERRHLCNTLTAMAAIFVQDPFVAPPFPGEAFAKLHGLTGSELRVLLAMAPGLSVKQTGELLGISETTARTHLQHIYEKTGTSKQTELMHLFTSSTPPVKAA
jgi:DNA-binding CsgD family transcriptional regulator/PAS domain-containing protein